MSRVLAPVGRRALPVVEKLTVGAYTVLRVADPDGPAPAAGQFYMLSTARRWGGGEGGRPFLPRAFSVLRRHPGGDLDFLIEAVGPGTERLCEVALGEELLVLGPLGRGFREPHGRRALLVGGGVGIAPVAILQDQLADAAADPALALLGFRDSAHATGAELLREARVATDDGSRGHHGLVTDLLEDELEAGSDVVVYACGPPGMLEAIRRRLVRDGVPGQLALESGMACGYGGCFGCAVSTRAGLIRLCLDGPVLDAEEVVEVAAH